jgi:hypothetical protein
MKWEPIIPTGPPEDQPLTRDDHTAVNFNDQAMIVFGGFVDGGERTNELWSYSYDGNRWHQIKPQGKSPKARAGHSSILRGN